MGQADFVCQATVQEAERCLPVSSGASSNPGPLTVNGTYTEVRYDYVLGGEIKWTWFPEELEDWRLTWRDYTVRYSF